MLSKRQKKVKFKKLLQTFYTILFCTTSFFNMQYMQKKKKKKQTEMEWCDYYLYKVQSISYEQERCGRCGVVLEV